MERCWPVDSDAVRQAVCNVEMGRDGVLNIILGILKVFLVWFKVRCVDIFFGMTSIKVFKVCYLTANVFFALCKYSTGKGLVTNVNKEKKMVQWSTFFSVFLIFTWIFKMVSLRLYIINSIVRGCFSLPCCHS